MKLTPEENKKNAAESLKLRTGYMILQHRFHFKRMMIKYANPKITDAIDDLTGTVFGFLDKGAKGIKSLKKDVKFQVCEMRKKQYEIDIKMARLYDNTLKINSFLCLCNR
jgi:hypothetical protein